MTTKSSWNHCNKHTQHQYCVPRSIDAEAKITLLGPNFFMPLLITRYLCKTKQVPPAKYVLHSSWVDLSLFSMDICFLDPGVSSSMEIPGHCMPQTAVINICCICYRASQTFIDQTLGCLPITTNSHNQKAEVVSIHVLTHTWQFWILMRLSKVILG